MNEAEPKFAPRDRVRVTGEDPPLVGVVTNVCGLETFVGKKFRYRVAFAAGREEMIDEERLEPAS